MPRKPKTIPGPSRLSKILAGLKRSPVLTLPRVRSLSLTYALRNDHFGARHFAKDELPRIQYANPSLRVTVNKTPKAPTEAWKPEMVVEYRTGQKETFSLDKKWSSTIVKELMDKAGGEEWARWKEEAKRDGRAIILGEEKEFLPKLDKTLEVKKSRSKRTRPESRSDTSQSSPVATQNDSATSESSPEVTTT